MKKQTNKQTISYSRKHETIEFYRNELGALPNRETIDTILQPTELGGWFGDWDLLEAKHNYIQICGFLIISVFVLSFFFSCFVRVRALPQAKDVLNSLIFHVVGANVRSANLCFNFIFILIVFF